MPPPYGLTPTGFNPKTSEEILEDIATEQQTAIGPLWQAKGLSLAGVQNGTFADALAELWEAGSLLFRQFDRVFAEGEGLDTVGNITGTQRRPRRRTVVITTSLMVPGTTVAAGEMIAHVVGDANRRFANSFAFTVPGSGMVGVNIDAQFECLEFGPISCPATMLTLRDTAVVGWLAVTNMADGVLGADVETNADYRIRQESEIAAPGSATAPAILTAVGLLAGVTAVFILINDTDSINGDGVPPHAMEVVVEGGVSAEIAQTIFNEKAPGDGTSGGVLETVAAPDGLLHAIRFTRPALVAIHVAISIQHTSEYPGDAVLKAAIVAWANRVFAPGVDVVPSRIASEAFNTAGVWNVPSCTAGTSGPGVPTVTAIGVRSKASFDTTRIVVTVIP